ncbi:MAG: bifunctional methylenetetrahydrofolate dehydrogenase/methenyltetrahydrofolate cyclohydrolase FolD [Luteolibacter sp.]|uniref:bifunctional methylenetetrahydrofolate dehydrogenase/methenyltetrahydrofolate cyclohydrolase FolD n=1 Tax=Luteolibacter sp. TaxID=1962973 RepID=UPI003266A0E2
MNSPKILDGKSVAAAVLDECRAETAELLAKGIQPGLAVVLVGADPASQVYVGSKARTCAELGFHSVKIELSAETTQDELLQVVRDLNADPKVHGILVQFPLPKHINEEAIIRGLDSRKDVDGFHPENVAKLVLEDPTGFVPCTPAGCMKLLEISGIETSGAEAVVLGRSMLVGKSVASLLVSKNSNATVTIAHSRSKDLPAICRRADILIAAVGRPEMVKADWVKPGAVVIDVGINRVEDSTKKSGFRLTGDVAYAEVAPLCSAITPVPGGVGPMTIAMLMKNTLQAARQIGA